MAGCLYLNGSEVTVTPEDESIQEITTGSFFGDLLMGEIPIIGTAIDLYNAYAAFKNGDYFGAALNTLSAIPLAGVAAKIGKKAWKAVTPYLDDFVEGHKRMGEDIVSGLKRAEKKLNDWLDGFFPRKKPAIAEAPTPNVPQRPTQPQKPQQHKMDGPDGGGPKFPIAGSWLKKTRNLKEIRNGCEKVADKLVKELDGAKYLQITPRGPRLGPVEGKFSEWFWHVAAIVDGRVYDRLTGPKGMPFDEYAKLFDYRDAINFTITAKRTLE